MSASTETLDQPSIVPDLRETVADRRPSRLNQVAAWVAIIAGIVFIVGSVFFTGFFLGRHSGGGWHHSRGGPEMGFRGGPMMVPMMPGAGPSMGPRGGMGPGMMPGMGPDRDEMPGPAQLPSSPAPR